MRKILFLGLFLIFNTSVIFSQNLKIFSIPASQDADTLNACMNSPIILSARKTDSTALDSETYYEWNYGNNIIESGTDLDSVSITYEKGGGYFVQLRTIGLNNDTMSAVKYIRIGLTPYFTGTTTNLDTNSVCFDGKNNDIVDLRAQIIHRQWKYSFPYEHTENSALEINSGKPYVASIAHEIYSADDKIKSADDIDTVGIFLEHSDAKNLEISLICPSGKSVKLKNFGTKKDFMGEPVANAELDTTQGKPYWYFFTEKTPSYGKMSQEEQQHFFSFTDNADSSYINEPYFPQGSYLPEESFSNLTGCPYNGNWTIAVVDNSIPDNGYIKAWKLVFDSIPPAKTFINTNKKYLWSSNSAAKIIGDSTSLTAQSEPQIENVFAKITFTITDDFSCPYDTSLLFEIQPAEFTANPQSGDADLEVQFTNLTRWKNATYAWNFGDGNTAGNETSPQNTYVEKGNYKVVLHATSTFGCINTDTLTIKVTAPVSSVEAFNVFTPNNDGINDRFMVKTSGLRTARLIIYDRGGKKIADLNSLDEVEKGWDGTLHNKGNQLMAPGLYFYTIIAVGKDDVEHKKSGILHLFRSR